MRDDDAKLLAAVLARDSRAWRDLVRHHEVALRAAIREASDRELSDHEVDDTLGDFWLLLLEDDLRRLREFRGSDLAGWLSMLAGQVAVNRARKLAREPVMEPLHELRNLADSSYLTTAEAALYLRYQTTSAIRNLKMKGLLKPAGRRGSTSLYRREDLDRFVETGCSMMPGGRPDAPGKAYSHELDGRLEADRASGCVPGQRGIPRSRARDGSQNRHAEGGKPSLRRNHAARSAHQAGGAARRDPVRKPGRGSEAGEVRRFRRVALSAKDSDR
jgi:hypothetical protein